MQQLIDAAAPGDTVDVPAGTHSGPVVVDKPLTLAGVDADDDARDRTGDGSVITGGIRVTADNVTIDGLTIQGALLGPGLELSGGGTNRDVVNNVITGNVFGLYLNGSDVQVRHNRFHDNNVPGAVNGTHIYSDQGAGNVAIDENRFTRTDLPASDIDDNSAINFAGGPPQRDIAIAGNSFVADSAIYLEETTGARITGNTSTDSHTHAVQVEGGNAGVEVSGNDFQRAGWSAVRVSDFAGNGPSSGVSVEGNTLVGQGDSAIRVSDGAHAGPIEAHYNRIDGTGADAILNNDPDQVDARWNWWGCNAGPGAPGCLPVVEGHPGNVDSSARLQLSLTADRASMLTGGEAATLTADLTRTSAGDDFGAVPFPASEVAFGTNLGTIAPSSRALAGGLATTTLVSGADPGTATLTATLDGETVGSGVRFDRPPEPPQQEQQQQQQEEQPIGDTTGPAIGVVRRRLRLSSRGEVGISVFCPAEEAAGCPIEATVDSAGPVLVRSAARRRKRQVRFGTTTVVIPAGRLTVVQVRFTRRGRQIARRLRKVRLRVTVVSRDALGNATTVTLPFTLFAPR